jgi:hypothetical protein
MRLLEAIIEMATCVEAGSVDDYRGGSESVADRKAYEDAIDAGLWARQEKRRRGQRRMEAHR